MFFDVAVLLYSSAIGSVAEAFSVPANSYGIIVDARYAADSGAPTRPIGGGAPFLAIAPVNPSGIPSRLLAAAVPTRVPLSELSAMSGTALLQQLGLLPESTAASFLAAHPRTVTDLLASPPAAVDVGRWWAALEIPAQDGLTAAAPQLVGGLDGVPAAQRNTANRLWLAESKTRLEAAATASDGRAVVDAAERQIAMLDEVNDVLGTQESVPARSLLSVDPRGQGRAAVVLGDLATADYVTYLIPGMFFTVGGQINDWTDDAARLYDEQVAWLHLIGEADPAHEVDGADTADEAASAESPAAPKTVAVIAWMGYETPNLTNIGSLDLAEKGRDSIAHAIEGLQTERIGNRPYITIVAHSYGSTAALMALTEFDFSVDALAVVGSPGSAAQSVDDLHVRGGNVFVGEAAWDPVPNSAYFGSDPGSEKYGAKRLNVDGGMDLITNQALAASVGHNGYFGAGSESIRNLALVGIGQGELVTDGTQNDRDRTLALVK